MLETRRALLLLNKRQWKVADAEKGTGGLEILLDFMTVFFISSFKVHLFRVYYVPIAMLGIGTTKTS